MRVFGIKITLNYITVFFLWNVYHLFLLKIAQENRKNSTELCFARTRHLFIWPNALLFFPLHNLASSLTVIWDQCWEDSKRRFSKLKFFSRNDFQVSWLFLRADDFHSRVFTAKHLSVVRAVLSSLLFLVKMLLSLKSYLHTHVEEKKEVVKVFLLLPLKKTWGTLFSKFGLCQKWSFIFERWYWS